jgi:hypothetical protein
MEKRIYKRKIVGFKVELLADGISYIGIVENISEKGLYMIVNPSRLQLILRQRENLNCNFSSIQENH